jgi:methylglyoxal synthase
MGEEKKTLVAVLASHDSIKKNNELATVFEDLYNEDSTRLSKFHFLFTGGTFSRLVLGEDTEPNTSSRINGLKPIKNKVKKFIIDKCGVTRLPDRKYGGVTILANLIVQRQCNIIWPFLSPITTHWLNPENLALMRLCDLWNVKRLMNAESVRGWFDCEAKRDIRRNPQNIPLIMDLGTPDREDKGTNIGWPKAEWIPINKCYEIKLPIRKKRAEKFWTDFERQTIALIAHDAMKNRMVDFAILYESELLKFGRILSTGTTGQEVENACRRLRENNKVRRCLSGPKGGDIEIATEILFDRCNYVVFFIDPLHPHAHTDDIRVVFSACMAEIENNDVRMLTNEVQAREWIEEAVRRRSI